MRTQPSPDEVVDQIDQDLKEIEDLLPHLKTRLAPSSPRSRPSLAEFLGVHGGAQPLVANATSGYTTRR